MSIERQFEREVELIENDDILTLQEKANQIHEMEREMRDYIRQEAQDTYDEIINSY